MQTPTTTKRNYDVNYDSPSKRARTTPIFDNSPQTSNKNPQNSKITPLLLNLTCKTTSSITITKRTNLINEFDSILKPPIAPDNRLSTAICSSCRLSGHSTKANLKCPNNKKKSTATAQTSNTLYPNNTTTTTCSSCFQKGHSTKANSLCPNKRDEDPNDDEIDFIAENPMDYKTNGADYLIARRKTFSEDLIKGPKIVEDLSDPHFRRFKIEKRDQICQFCNALMWFEERVKSTSKKNNLLFSMCCNSGRVRLPELCPIDPIICEYLTGYDFKSAEFRTSIRMYNSLLSFTSMDAQVDKTLIQNNRGTFTYRINGAIHHKIGDVLPADKENPHFSQIYIYDQSLQTDYRKKIAPTAKADTLNALQK